MIIDLAEDSILILNNYIPKLAKDLVINEQTLFGSVILSKEKFESACLEVKCVGLSEFKISPPISVLSSNGNLIRNKIYDQYFKYNYDLNINDNYNLEKDNILLGCTYSKLVQSDITPGRAYLLGLFAAEGSYNKKNSKRVGICLTLGYHENSIASRIKEIFDLEFPECSLKIYKCPIRSIISVTATGYNIQEYFYYHIGEHCDHKILSSDIVFGQAECKKQFILGWLDGDGHYSEKDGKLIGITTSFVMAWQIKMILNSLLIKNNIRNIASKKRKVIDRISNCKEIWRLEISSGECNDLIKDSARFKINKNISHKEKKMAFVCIDKYFSTHTIINIAKSHNYFYKIKFDKDCPLIINSILLNNIDIT